ncbi:hypothetical protein [Microcoleus sp. FACHB-672]|uniref:hypothetical protein n=1 Tax=Microcoleus sp. FACHB-672 TaxID=2692825 RepID=UPI001683D549|nr:hypothetical protein [Microcoleus sp. FACHB-672]MBD2043283.1 hypothetical protein [Microcoleus sp. FACHB-672]
MGQFIFFALLVGYGVGMWKFWKGFERTNFERSLPNRVKLALLWPGLWVANPSYRKNFTKALKGR